MALITDNTQKTAGETNVNMILSKPNEEHLLEEPLKKKIRTQNYATNSRLKRLPPPFADVNSSKHNVVNKRAQSMPSHVEVTDLCFVNAVGLGSDDDDGDHDDQSSSSLLLLATTNRGSIVVWKIEQNDDQMVVGTTTTSMSTSNGKNKPISQVQISSRPLTSMEIMPHANAATKSDSSRILVTSSDGLYSLDLYKDILSLEQTTKQPIQIRTSGSASTMMPLPPLCQVKVYQQHAYAVSPVLGSSVLKMDLETQQLVTTYHDNSKQSTQSRPQYQHQPRGFYSDSFAHFQNANHATMTVTSPFSPLSPKPSTPVLQLIDPSAAASATQGPQILVGTSTGCLTIYDANSSDRGTEIIDIAESMMYHGKNKPAYKFGSSVAKSTKTASPSINAIASSSSSPWWTIAGSMDASGQSFYADKSNGWNPNAGGYISTWHGPTRSIVACAKTQSSPQALQSLSDGGDGATGFSGSLVSVANEGVITVWESACQLNEPSRRIWSSPPSGNATAVTNNFRPTSRDDDNLRLSGSIVAPLLAVGGVGPIVDLFHQGCKYTSLFIH